MKHSLDKKSQAKELRILGYSYREISQELLISKSTASLWTRGIFLSKTALERIENNKKTAREKN